MIKTIVSKCLWGAAAYSLTLGLSLVNPDSIRAEAWEACSPDYYQASPRQPSAQSTLSITVARDYGSPVDIYWIDFNGQRQHYGTVQPGRSMNQQTYAGHNWVLSDGANCEYLTAENGGTFFEAISDAPFEENFSSGNSQDYGFTNIVNAPGVYEDLYAVNVRGWRVFSGSVNGQFSYCVAEKGGRGRPLRLGYDNRQWQIAMRFSSPAQWDGQLEVDGRKSSTSGTSDGQWTIAWLDIRDVERIKNGNNLIVSVGRGDADYALSGSAASILKIEECLQTRGIPPTARTTKRKPNNAPVRSTRQNRPVESDAQRMAGGCPRVGTVFSAGTNEPATVDFVDQASQRDGAKQIYWLDGSGNPVDIAIFENGAASLDAYVGHKFIVKNFSGTCFGGVFTVRSGHNQFIVR